MRAEYIRSKTHTFSIANTKTGSLLDPVNLGRPYKTLLIECYDCDNIAAATNLTAEVGVDSGSTMGLLYEQDDPSTLWSKGALPTTAVTMAFALTHAFGMQRIRFILTNAASGGTVVLKITGIDQGA